MEKNMFIKLKNVLLLLIFAALVVQLGGCIFSRHDHWSDDEHPGHHDSDRDHGDIDIHLH